MALSRKLVQLSLVLAAALAGAQAQTAAAAASAGPGTAPARMPLARGKVIEVDRQQGRVLVEHGPIQSIGMDAMTMEFAVPDGKLLASLKPGDRIRFAAAWKDGDYVVTRARILKRGPEPKKARTP
jgi:Cu(I)/Ag(I) efflux system periplasmic protein CusF